jgi:hypothetical protein
VYAQRGRYTVTVRLDDGHGRTRTDRIAVDVFGQALYVDAGATGNGSGTLWSDAVVSLAEALKIVPAGVEIWVADGTCPGKISRVSGVAVYGGFVGGEAQRSERNVQNNPPAVISWGYWGHQLVTATGLAERATIDGFTIQDGGSFGNGGGLYCQGSPLTIRNNRFTNNFAYAGGAAIALVGCPDVLIENNTLTKPDVTIPLWIRGWPTQF